MAVGYAFILGQAQGERGVWGRVGVAGRGGSEVLGAWFWVLGVFLDSRLRRNDGRCGLLAAQVLGNHKEPVS